MVKQIQIILDDDEYDELMKVKGERTWKDILMEADPQYAEVLEKARKWDEVEPYLPKLTAHLLIEYLKKAVDSIGFPDEEEG